MFDEGFVRGSDILPHVQWEVEGVHQEWLSEIEEIIEECTSEKVDRTRK